MKFNFKLLKNEYIKDILSHGFIYRHTSGAKLVFIKNNDNNKVFSITFKTLPENNKGTAHIMEHSVLCGSEKYPVKDPFNELEKGSLNTYLNAMTFEDKTMYPVASTNEKDFINLMNVYLDAVFFPLIYKRKGIFLQEGHHNEKDSINGVVYNEMKGVFSSHDRIIDFKLNEKLLEDTKYRFYSGGVPEYISELSYEEFLDFHKKYYHPSNSILYLYGDIDIDKYLEIIDREYLSRFEYKNQKIDYITQGGFSEIKDAEFTYDVSEYTHEDKNYFECGAIIGNGLDTKLSFAFEILTDILLETDGSPLKKAFIKNEVGNNVYGRFDNEMFQTVFSVSVEKTKCDSLEKFKKVYFDTLNDIVENGLDKRLIESCINRYKFYFKEENYGYKPRGLVFNILIMKSFIYGDGNFDEIKFEELFNYTKNLKFEELIKKYLINNKNYVFSIMKPKIKQTNKSIILEPDEEFEKYKKITDSEKDIIKIPVLSIDDIDKKSQNININKESICGRKLIYSKTDNDDIIYVNLLFDTRILDVEDLKYFSLFKYIFGKTDTKKFGYGKLANELNFYFGKFLAGFDSYDQKDDFLPVLTIEMKFLSENTENAFKLAREVIFNSVIDKNRLKELIYEYKILFEKNFVRSGHIYAISRCLSYLSDRNKYSQKINGMDFYDFIKNAADNFDEMADVICEKIIKIMSVIFNANNFMAGLVCSDKNYNNVFKLLQNFYGELNKSNFTQKISRLEKNYVNEAFLIESEVQYNVIAANYKQFGKEFNGKMRVIEKIIESDYIWNKIRVDGGAYGGGCSFLRGGLLYLYSYRDPNVERTFDKYKEIADYLKNIELSERELCKYIIGTINIIDRPVLISGIMDKMLQRTLSGISDEKRQIERDEILSITKNDVTEFSDVFRMAVDSGYICSFGSKDEIKKSNIKFKKIYVI